MTEKLITSHGTCPTCGHQDCYSEWEGGGSFCHSCGEAKKNKSSSSDPLAASSKVEAVRYRSLNQQVIDKYKVLTHFDSEGKEFKREYSYPHASKYRILPKDFSKNYGFKADKLYGMDKFNAGSSKNLTIVEGEDDTHAAWQMLGGTTPVVGLPSATISAKLLQDCHDYIDSFENIIIATDNDEAGNRAANRIAAAFYNKNVYRVQLTKYNDPMEYLENKDVNEFKFAWGNKVKFVPDFDTSTPDGYLRLIAEEDDDEYIPTGILDYDRDHLGLFQGHVTMFLAPEGTGKTELFHYFEHHLIKNYPDVPFATCHLEETKRRTLLGWVSYDLNKNVTRKDLILNPEEVNESVKRLTEREQAHLFKIGTDEDPLVILDRIKYYANVCGCKYVFLEPIQDLAQQYYGPDSTERFLSKIAVNLARIASELGIGIVLIGHQNDEGLVSDCRKLSKQASVVVHMVRDMDSRDPIEKNSTKLYSKKNRPTAHIGFAGEMYFNPDTFTLKEKD